MNSKFFVERDWVGRAFCYSRIVDQQEGVELTGYVWYGGRKPTKDSRLHREVDYAIRDILREATGKTTGSAYVDAAIVLRHIKEWYEECEWEKKPSYRVAIIKKWLERR